MDTTITEVEWMGREATNADADMHARAGDAELIFASDTEAECCHDGGLLLWSSGNRWCRWCR